MMFCALVVLLSPCIHSPQMLHETSKAYSNPRKPVTPSCFATIQFLSGAHFYRLISFPPFTLLSQEWILAKEGLGGTRAVTADLGWFKVLWTHCLNSLLAW